MTEWHDIPRLPAGLVEDHSEDGLRLALPEGPVSTFVPVWLTSLSARRAAELVASASNELSLPMFVIFRRSSPDARSALRDAGISFAGEDGSSFIRAPGIYVERDELMPRSPSHIGGADADHDARARNPFANRSSRVARWMLGHPDQVFSPSSIAQAVDLNPAAVSRILTALEDPAFIRQTDAATSRRRSVVLTRPLALLEEWLVVWQRRRIQRSRWDVGAHDVAEALDMLRAVQDTPG